MSYPLRQKASDQPHRPPSTSRVPLAPLPIFPSPTPPLPNVRMTRAATASAPQPSPIIDLTGNLPTSSHPRPSPDVIADGQRYPAGGSGSRTTTNKRKASAITQPVESTAKRSRAGRPNWRSEEIDILLDLVEAIRPGGQQGWQGLADEYRDWAGQDADRTSRTAKQLEDKFKNVRLQALCEVYLLTSVHLACSQETPDW